MHRVRLVVGLLVVLAVVLGIGSFAYAKDMSGTFSVGFERDMWFGKPFHSGHGQDVAPWWSWWQGENGRIVMRGWFTPRLGAEGALGMTTWQRYNIGYYWPEGTSWNWSDTSYALRILFKVVDNPNSHLFIGIGPRFHNLNGVYGGDCDAEFAWTGTGFDAFMGMEWFATDNVAIAAQFGYSQVVYDVNRPSEDEYSCDSTLTLAGMPLRVSVVYYLGAKK